MRSLLFIYLVVVVHLCGRTSSAIGQEVSPGLSLGQGIMSGEVTDTTVLLQTRLTKGTALDTQGDLPGAEGVVRFEWSERRDFAKTDLSPLIKVGKEQDYIARILVSRLKPATTYFYRVRFGQREEQLRIGPTGSFRTHLGPQVQGHVRFIVGSCMNYCKFMYGKAGNAGPAITATAEDKKLGFPAFSVMKAVAPDFFIGTGDIVYYDNPYRRSETIAELRRCWHEQFRFPRMKQFFLSVPSYWSKDDHDFRYNDSDNTSDRLPNSQTGIDLFREQLPIAPQGKRSPNYRTHRVSKDLQIWLTEGRDHRSPNDMLDGPEKTIWGKEQLRWLKATLLESDATWKVLISPTPLVGPDMAKKSDNHTSLKGFRHEADAFFKWLAENDIGNFVTVCGDRHWQYHSVHPSGINEFACGALNDENARLGIAPGERNGTDPEGRIRQLFTSPTPSGGFLEFHVGNELHVNFLNDDGKKLYEFSAVALGIKN